MSEFKTRKEFDEISLSNLSSNSFLNNVYSDVYHYPTSEGQSNSSGSHVDLHTVSSVDVSAPVYEEMQIQRSTEPNDRKSSVSSISKQVSFKLDEEDLKKLDDKKMNAVSTAITVAHVAEEIAEGLDKTTPSKRKWYIILLIVGGILAILYLFFGSYISRKIEEKLG